MKMVTLGLILLNVLVFIGINAVPSLSEVFLLDPDLAMVLAKPWTLFTVFFAHQILIHIVLNMVVLFFFGKTLEKEASWKVLLSAYVLCGFVGSLSTLAYAAAIGYDGPLIAGASAAAFGVAATYAGLRPNAAILGSKAKHWVVALFVVNILLTIQNPQLSVGGPAHAIGILLGLGLGYFLKRRTSTV